MGFEKELEIARGLAHRAGVEILEHYAREIIAEQKLGVDMHYEPVTAADRAASRIIVEGLAEAFPDDAILSEEEDDVVAVRLGRERVWIIDPIDGTAGFVKKDGDFAVQIGLAERGKAVVGVVLLPFHGVTYYATTGAGAFKESAEGTDRVQASAETDYSKMYMAVSRNHPSPKIRNVFRSLGLAGELNRGSVGLKIGLIAEQACDLYIHLSPRTKLWDTCGPQVILEEAGGRLTDLFGEEFRYDIQDLQNHGGICATNGAAHDETIRRLRPLLNDFGRLKYRTKAT
ncbi:MAG: 3'(2'),5'-bisphosphate nucleotidase CysQ [bacterium]|nr:3'(2'),5'-bisphosphate nucleotidase CysQ [bacterium]